MQFFYWGRSSSTLLSALRAFFPLGSLTQRLETNSSGSVAVRAHGLGLYEHTSVLNVGVVVPDAKVVSTGERLRKMRFSS